MNSVSLKPTLLLAAKLKKSDISNSLCCRFFSSQFILFLPGNFLTTVGNFSLTYKVKIIIISLRDFSFLRCFNDFFFNFRKSSCKSNNIKVWFVRKKISFKVQ